MSEWPIESIRAVSSAAVLVALLTWESFGPFFDCFSGAPGERVRHGVRNVLLGVLNASVTGLVFVSLWWTVTHWAEAHQFGVLHWLRLPDWARVAGVFLLLDGWMYLWHRLNHRVPFFWRFHRVHHSDPMMDVTTANRFHVGETVLSGLLRAPVLALLGVRLWELALYELAMFTVVQMHHANVSVPGPVDRCLRLLIVTPLMHKVHHSDWQPETDSNYASLFSFWDRLLGTFRLRDDPRTLRFGLRELAAPEHHTLGGLLATPFRQANRPGTAPPDEPLEPRRP